MGEDCVHDLILRDMHHDAQRLAFAWYLRRGRAPAKIKVILEATASREAFEKYSADQPRAPAGTPEGGQWTDGGGGSGTPKIQREALHQAMGQQSLLRSMKVLGAQFIMTRQEIRQ